MKQLICAHCGTDFLKTGRKYKFCSVVCRKKYNQKLWRDRNPDRVKARNYFDNSDVNKRILIRAKSRAKKQGIPFDLTIEDIIVPEFCPVLGIRLEPDTGRDKRGFHPKAASLDKIKPELGYIKGNVRVISARANLLKNNASLDEMRLILKDLEAIENSNI